MTAHIAAVALDIAKATLAGVVAAAISAALLYLLSRRQRRRVQSLARADVDPEAVARAALEAQRDQPDLLREVLRSAVIDVAADQGVSEGLVRGALFAPSPDGDLHILESQTVNFDSPEAERIRIQPGETGVGEAIRSGSPVVTVFREPLKETTIKDPMQRERVNPSLRWIIAVPIFGAEGNPVWVLSIDGLVDERSVEQLQSSVGHLLYYREVLELIVKSLARDHESGT